MDSGLARKGLCIRPMDSSTQETVISSMFQSTTGYFAPLKAFECQKLTRIACCIWVPFTPNAIVIKQNDSQCRTSRSALRSQMGTEIYPSFRRRSTPSHHPRGIRWWRFGSVSDRSLWWWERNQSLHPWHLTKPSASFGRPGLPDTRCQFVPKERWSDQCRRGKEITKRSSATGEYEGAKHYTLQCELFRAHY